MPNQSIAQSEQTINNAKSVTDPKHLWSSFSWVSQNEKATSRHLNFTTQAMDIVGGVAICLEMLEHDSLQEVGEEQPERVLSVYQAGCIMRMCITSLQMLQNRASVVVSP